MADDNQPPPVPPKHNIIRKTDDDVSLGGIREEHATDIVAFRETLIEGNDEFLSKLEDHLLVKSDVSNVWESRILDSFSNRREEVAAAKAAAIDIDVIDVDAVEVDENGSSDFRENLTRVTLVEFGDTALSQLRALSGMTDGSSDIKQTDSKTKGPLDIIGDIFKKLMVVAVPLLALGGAFISSVTHMLGGGEMTGVFNILSKTSLMAGMGVFKTLGLNFFKKLPIIGSLISIGSAIARIKNGDFLGGAIDLVAATAYMFPIVGTPMGIAMDLLNTSIDLTKSRTGETGIIGVVGTWGKWIGDNRYKIPFIGSLCHLGEAFMHLGLGHFKEAGASLGNAGLSIPFMGTMLDWLAGDIDETTGETIEGSGALSIQEMIETLSISIREKLLSMVKSATTGAVGWLNSIGVPEHATNSLLGMMGLDSMVDDDDKRAHLHSKVTELYNTSTSGGRTEIRNELLDQGYSKDEIAGVYTQIKNRKTSNTTTQPDAATSQDEHTQALKENTQAMREGAASASTVVSNNNQSSSTTNHNYGGDAISAQRIARRQILYNNGK